MDLLTKIEKCIIHGDYRKALSLIRDHRKEAQKEIECAVYLSERCDSQDYQIEQMKGIISGLVSVIDQSVRSGQVPIETEWHKIKKEYDL